jgi:uncharacterized protein YcaQ
MPQEKRKVGYYALPVFWDDQAIGWVNSHRVRADGTLDVKASFVERKPVSRAFWRSFDREVASLQTMIRSCNP